MDKARQVDAVKHRGGRGNTGGIRAFARYSGRSEISVRRSLKVASLTEEAKQVARDTGLDNNRSALLSAAAEAPELQAEALRRIAQRGKVRQVDAPARCCPHCGGAL